MINVNDFKTGMTIEFDNNIFQVMEFLHVKPGKGPAFVRSKLKNLRTGANIEHTFNAGIKVGKAMVEKKTMQFLYNTGDIYVFMNMETYEQVELQKSQIEEETNFLKENLEVEIMFYKNEMLGIILPDKIEMKVTRTEPGVKGNTTSSATKDAILETGMLLKVPLFIDEGETVVISTKDGKYASRK